MNNELRKNAEGYTDPTAAATLTQPEPGDIWTHDGSNIFLVIKSHGPFCTGLLLMDDCGGPNDVEIVTGKGTKYTDPRRLSYSLRRKMFQYLETVDCVTFEHVVTAVEDALAIDLLREAKATNTETTDTREAAELREQLTIALEHIKVLESLKNMDKAELDAAHKATEKAKNQLELLRDMYNELLAKVVEG